MPPEVAREHSARHAVLLSRALITAAVAVCAFLLVVVGSGLAVQAGTACASCHAMAPYAEAQAAGSHVSVGCTKCHVRPDAAAILSEGLRAVGWGMGALAGREPTPVVVPDSVCRACHAPTLEDVIVSEGIAVRHADYVAQPCTDCHAGNGHEVPSRWYPAVAMDDCMTCHEGAESDPAACDRCHVGDVDRPEDDASWGPTHGSDWMTTHGKSDQDTCGSCHPPRACLECHGVLIPHPADWVVSHGGPAAGETAGSCALCHEAAWCTDCHGLEMPHPAEFLSEHGPLARVQQDEVCVHCHGLEACDACHFASSHPETAGVDIGHRW